MTAIQDAWELRYSCMEKSYKPIKFVMGANTYKELRSGVDAQLFMSQPWEEPSLFGVPYEVDVDGPEGFLELQVKPNLMDITLGYRPTKK